MRQIFIPVLLSYWLSRFATMLISGARHGGRFFGIEPVAAAILILVLFAGPAGTSAAIMNDSPPAMELSSANGTRIYFGPDSLFLPSLALFSLGSGDFSVRLSGVGPASPAEGAGADFRLQDESSPRSLDTFLTFRTGETATIRTTLADYAPALRFDLVSGAPAGFGLLADHKRGRPPDLSAKRRLRSGPPVRGPGTVRCFLSLPGPAEQRVPGGPGDRLRGTRSRRQGRRR